MLVVETFAEKELLETPELFEAPFSEEEHTTRREESKELFPAAERGKILRTPNWLTSSLVNGGEERRNGELTKNGGDGMGEWGDGLPGKKQWNGGVIV